MSPKIKFIEDHWLLKHMGKGWAGITLYNTIYIRKAYAGTARGEEVIAHEKQHWRDQQRWPVFFFLTYIFVLPALLSMRAFWEWRAYKETLRVVHMQNKDGDPKHYEYMMDYTSEWVASQFCESGYVWMFPFKKFMYNKCKAYVKSLQ